MQKRNAWVPDVGVKILGDLNTDFVDYCAERGVAKSCIMRVLVSALLEGQIILPDDLHAYDPATRRDNQSGEFDTHYAELEAKMKKYAQSRASSMPKKRRPLDPNQNQWYTRAGIHEDPRRDAGEMRISYNRYIDETYSAERMKKIKDRR